LSYAQLGTRWAREVVETRPPDLPAEGELPRQVLDWAPLTGDRVFGRRKPGPSGPG